MKNPVFNVDINQFTNRSASGSGFLTMAPVLENKSVSIDSHGNSSTPKCYYKVNLVIRPHQKRHRAYNTNGTIATAYDYTPYGAVTATGIDQPFQWSSEVYDAELGMIYYNYRYYNPTDGRRLGRELLGETASMQLYSFSRNRMTNVFDYLGLNVYDINETNYDVRLHPEQKSNTNDFVKRADKSESPQYYGGSASNWLGMYNAVCMNMISSYDDGRPGNINHYHHAVKSKDSTIFPNLKSGDHNERPYTNKDGSGSSHNDIGEKLGRRLIQRIQLWSTGQKIQKLK